MLDQAPLFTNPPTLVRGNLLPLLLILLMLIQSNRATAEYGGKNEDFHIFDRDKVKVIELEAVKGWDFTHEVS